MPAFLRGVMLAALAGAVMSTFNSGINSASTIFTVDIYSKYINKQATARRQVRVGRIATGVIALFACVIAPLPGKFEGVFNYIQEIWGFISPAILAAFMYGLIVKRAPAAAGKTALLLGPVLYGLIRVPKWILEGVYDYQRVILENGTWQVQRVLENADGSTSTEIVGGAAALAFKFLSWTFLHHMLLVFALIIIVMTWITMARPRTRPITYPTSNLDTRVHPQSYVLGSLIIAATVALYIIFW
jgi:SSS family solute:Na+ symporter